MPAIDRTANPRNRGNETRTLRRNSPSSPYLQYANITAKAVRNVLKEQPKIAALRREEQYAKVQFWKEGRQGETVVTGFGVQTRLRNAWTRKSVFERAEIRIEIGNAIMQWADMYHNSPSSCLTAFRVCLTASEHERALAQLQGLEQSVPGQTELFHKLDRLRRMQIDLALEHLALGKEPAEEL
ncbi:unnamed protein product [Sphagnum tenellum]